MGRMTSLMAGSRVKNHAAPSSTTDPLTKTVMGAQIKESGEMEGQELLHTRSLHHIIKVPSAVLEA